MMTSLSQVIVLLVTVCKIESMANLNINVTEGSTAILKCPTRPVHTWSDAQSDIIYTLNDDINPELSISQTMSLDKDRNLLINNFGKDDVRTYRCSTDDKGNPVWFDFNITLMFKPISDKNNRNITLSSVVGNITNISLDVNSYPAPTVSWGTGNGGTLGNWKVSTWSNVTSSHRLTSSVLFTARGQFGLYRAVIRNSEGSIDICIRFVAENMVDVQPKKVVCTTTQTVKLRCKFKNVEDPLPTFSWNHDLNGVRIRRLNGEDHKNLSILSIPYCSYQDVGDYTCTVACNGRNMTSTAYVIVQGAPVIIKQDVIADSSNVTLSVTYISEPPLMYIIWYINDENVNISNSSNHSAIVIQNIKADVAVKYYKTPIIMRVSMSKLSFHIAIVSHLDTISCHLKNRIGGREPMFDVSSITANDKEKRNTTCTTYESTTDSGSISEDLITTSHSDELVNKQDNGLLQKFMYIYVAVPCAVVLVSVLIVAAIVGKYLNMKFSVDLQNSNRVSANSHHPDTDREVAYIQPIYQSQYEEIDDVSYHSVTWRDYSLENREEATEMDDVVSNETPAYMNVQCYEELSDSLKEIHHYKSSNGKEENENMN